MEAALEWTGASPADLAARIERFGAAVPDELEAAAEEIALRIEADAARGVNVDTGRLRASIDNEVERVAAQQIRATVGSNVEYAPYQEVIDPYLRPAIENNRQHIEQRVVAALEAAWEASG